MEHRASSMACWLLALLVLPTTTNVKTFSLSVPPPGQLTIAISRNNVAVDYFAGKSVGFLRYWDARSPINEHEVQIIYSLFPIREGTFLCIWRILACTVGDYQLVATTVPPPKVVLERHVLEKRWAAVFLRRHTSLGCSTGKLGCAGTIWCVSCARSNTAVERAYTITQMDGCCMSVETCRNQSSAKRERVPSQRKTTIGSAPDFCQGSFPEVRVSFHSLLFTKLK